MIGYCTAWTDGGLLRLQATLEIEDITDFGREGVHNWATATYRTTNAIVISLVDAFGEEHLDGYTDDGVFLQLSKRIPAPVDYVVDEEVLLCQLLEPDVLETFPEADFLLEGEWKSYHRDGHPRVHLRYKDGRPIGPQYIYNEDHSILRTAE